MTEPAEGRYYQAQPMDYAILELLPEENTMLGYHYLGMQVKDVAAKLGHPSNEIQARMRSMAVAGIVVHRPLSSNRVWQRTAKGKELFESEGKAFLERMRAQQEAHQLQPLPSEETTTEEEHVRD